MQTALRLIITLAMVALAAGHGAVAADSPAVFQYATLAKTSNGERDAFLWIPHQAKQVRGILFAGMTLAERELVKDAAVRRVCSDESLAIVFLKTGISSVNVQQVLDDFAAVSGYRELSVAPVFFVGHSAGGPQAKAAAVKYRERCFGVMQYRGGSPGTPASATDTEPVPPGVPALMMLGQFDEFGKVHRDENRRENWENGVDSMKTFRSKDARNLGSFVAEPGAGHFAWSDRSATYFALFLRKSAKLRIPDWPLEAKTPVTCREIDAATGWLTELPSRTAARHKPAPADQYTGAKGEASWHLDREIAEATIKYHHGLVGKNDQFLRWLDPCTVEAGARFFFNEIKWVGDGQTLEVHPQYAEAFPKQYGGKGPVWAQAGKPVGKSSVAIRLRPVGGPLSAVGANTFRVKFDALAPATDPGRATFLAYSEGDDKWRYTEQVGMLRNLVLSEGKNQSISFPPLPNVKADAAPIKLNATSDSELPVEYYVAHGPATIEDGKLVLREMPRRSSFPLEVKVVAYQFGRGIEPRVKTATPVARILKVQQ